MSSPSYERINRLKRILFGQPKRTDQQHHERLSVPAALAVFSADGLSSIAYATEEILYVLVGAAGLAASPLVMAANGVYSLSIGLGIVILVLIVAASYNQTIHAYPTGGGSYVVAKENLGILPGLTAAAALLTDYVLTVAVSAASGVHQVVSAFPSLRGHEVALCLAIIWFIAWVNLRGVRESGAVFSVPTYSFIISIFVMIGTGLYKVLTQGWNPVAPIGAAFGMDPSFSTMTSGITLFVLLKAFSSGCTALTGLEAVSNGVQAFKPPEDKNAIRTMNLERTILYVMFAGITLLAFGYRIIPQLGGESVVSQIARSVFGNSFMYYVVIATTALILMLAANTAYADFPRLASLIARDGYLPRKLSNRGDTLVFHYGIYILASLASILIVLFQANVHHLIPLYAVGVFTAFTLSQTGMVVHWFKEAKKLGTPARKFWWSIFINGLGAFLCAIVTVVNGVSKFFDGAWLVLILIPLLVGYFLHVHNYYLRFRERVESLQKEHMTFDDARKIKVVLAIGGLSPVIDHTMRVARRISDDITAVYVAVEPELGEKIQRKWDMKRHGGVPLVVLPSPYRDVVGPLRKYLDKLHQECPDTIINLLVPVIVTNEPFDNYLHNGAADQILRDLRFSEGIIITEVPFYVNMSPQCDRVIAYHPVPDGND
jgi:amino acid transporter